MQVSTDQPVRFLRFQQVWITYPSLPARRATVERDGGGPKVLVRWRAQDGPKVGRNVVLYRGRDHEQWLPRERLEVRS